MSIMQMTGKSEETVIKITEDNFKNQLIVTITIPTAQDKEKFRTIVL